MQRTEATQVERGLGQSPADGNVVAAGEAAIVVSGLIKRYGATTAVVDLSFTVRPGEIFALLGPNGAGKTTTIEILEGYRRRDGGEVRVLGEDPQRSRTLRRRVGIMLQGNAIYPHITVREALALFCSYYPHPADPAGLLRLVGLEEKADARFKTLSGGQKQRLSLGLALAGNPELVFLDEPTAAMDPQARLVTWGVINELRARGVTLVLTTHYLEEAQRLADRVAIVDRGQLVALGTPAELMAQAQTSIVRFASSAEVSPAELATLPGARSARQERPGLYLVEGDDPDELLIEVALWARARRVRVTNLRAEQATLEDVFLKLTGERFVEGEGL
jgi:ABC-2 type transport system ATP-binding protein